VAGVKKGKKTEYDPSRERMARAKREKYLNKKLRRIVLYAYQHAPAFKDKLDRAGVRPSTIKTIKDLDKIPVTTQSEMVSLQ
jgi:phenylacetate-CoA ligase